MPDARQRIADEAAPLLEPDEAVAHVVRALEGPNRWLALLLATGVGLGMATLLRAPVLGVPILALVFTRLYARRMLLATDRALVIVAGTRWRFRPRAVISRLDLETPIGPLQGFWQRSSLDGRSLYVIPRDVGEQRAADADLDEA